jgi:molybdate transport system ATP-binding protein
MPAELLGEFTKSFAGGFLLRARLRIPLDVPSITVLFGPSGAGKTSILRCLAGLEQPDEGSILYRDETWCDVQRGISLPPQKRRIGYLPQDYALFPHLTVRRNIEYGLSKLPRTARRKRAEAMLELFELSEFRDHTPGQLSGGQLQRAGLARTLAPDPGLLLLDEPLSALDAPARARLRIELRRLLLQVRVPTILVTHDRTEAIALGDSLAVISEGEVRETGRVEEVFRAPRDIATAQAVGIETVQPARIIDRRNGLLAVEAGPVRLWAVDNGDLNTSSVFACIRAEEVVLEKSAPAGRTTARNHLPGRISSVISEGPLVRVSLDCGFPLVALITRQSCEELALAGGQSVTATLKAQAVHLIPRV